MPPRDWRQRVQDILDAIARIERHTAGITFDQFRANEKTLDAVLRNLAVTGEAARNISANVEAKHPEAPWADMRAMRNFVVHVYFGIDIQTIWDTMRNDLPPLTACLSAILRDEGADGP